MKTDISVKQSDPSPLGENATKLVRVTIILCVSSVIAIISVLILPLTLAHRLTVITTLVGVVTPIVAALISASVQEVHLAVNSRLSQLIEVTRQLATEKERSRHNDMKDE